MACKSSGSILDVVTLRGGSGRLWPHPMRGASDSHRTFIIQLNGWIFVRARGVKVPK